MCGWQELRRKQMDSMPTAPEGESEDETSDSEIDEGGGGGEEGEGGNATGQGVEHEAGSARGLLAALREPPALPDKVHHPWTLS